MKKAVTFYSDGVRLSGDVYFPEDLEPGDRRALAFYRGRGFAPAGEDILELILPQP